jgi:hypothetical protein
MTHGLSLTVGKWIERVVSCGLLDFLLCSVGDLNPILGFCFPLFSWYSLGNFHQSRNLWKWAEAKVGILWRLYIQILHVF